MTAELLAVMSGDVDGERPFDWPAWWPDDDDRQHLTIWKTRAAAGDVNIAWGARAIVDVDGQMLGHAGFHLPPQPVDVALDDPTFVGRRDHAGGGVVEVGYTVFPPHRQRGYATEALTALVEWAQRTGEASAVLATVEPANVPSLRVLQQAGGFVAIGTCRTDDGAIEVVYRRDLESDRSSPNTTVGRWS